MPEQVVHLEGWPLAVTIIAGMFAFAWVVTTMFKNIPK